MLRAIVVVCDSFGQDVLRLRESLLNLGLVVDQVGGLLTVLVSYSRVAASFAHHLYHLLAQLGILLVGEAHGDV